MKYLAFLTVLLAVPVFARQHTDLNGTWTLIPTKSDFAGQPVMQTGRVTINERQGDITVSRDFTYDGAKETVFYRDTMDSENGDTIHDGKSMKSKARWDHDALKVSTTKDGATTLETYSLSPGGTMICTVNRPGHAPFTLDFQRK